MSCAEIWIELTSKEYTVKIEEKKHLFDCFFLPIRHEN